MGLEPAGNDGYFQNVEMLSREYDDQKVSFNAQSKTWELNPRQAIPLGFPALTLDGVPLFKVTPDTLKTLKPEETEGKAVLIAGFAGNQLMNALGALSKGKPAVILTADAAARRMLGMAGGMGRLSFAGQTAPRLPVSAPLLTVNQKELNAALEALPAGGTDFRFSARLAPVEKKIVLRNVAGMVRGSDPVLKDEYILVTAHYDHVGQRSDLEGDGIFNGANDDASGTASVMELASAFIKMAKKPKRSLLFIALFGEEAGLLGSRAYAQSPLVPLNRTIANVNLEHIGRTDSSEGPKVNYGSFTGFDFSDLPSYFAVAAKAVGVSIEKDPKRSDAFFARSDNVALAQAGIPAHTLCVAFEFADYHQPGDHWDKLDYENMARVNRAVAAGLLMIANSPRAPQWNEKNDKTKRYVEAAKKLKESSKAASASSGN
jgi:hypothetical protein